MVKSGLGNRGRDRQPASPGAVDGLFGGLADDHQGAVPLIFQRRQHFAVPSMLVM